MRLPRQNTLQLTLVNIPPVGTNAPVTAQLTNMPEAVGQYRASLFVRFPDNNRLIGPAPGCNALTAGVQLQADPNDRTAATVAFPDWAAQNPGWVNDVSGFVVAVYMSAYVITGVPGEYGAPATCLQWATNVGELPNTFPFVAQGAGVRVVPPTVSSSLTAAATASRTRSGSASASIAASPDVSASASPSGSSVRLNGLGTDAHSGTVAPASSAEPVGASRALTAVATACMAAAVALLFILY